VRKLSVLANLGVWLVALGVLGVALAPVGFRLGWWDFAFALRKLLALASLACAVGFVLCVVAWLLAKTTQGTAPSVRLHAALVLGALVSGYLLLQLKQVRSVPMIHDIVTDTEHPPQFVALAAARRASPNGNDYRGAQIAQQQKAAYPDIAPFVSSFEPQVLFEKALAAAQAAGWHIAAAEPSEGRIEATATSAIFGFKDDIVIRIAPRASSSILDMRSMSRVGISDLGVNAKRIRAFLASLR
jgi:uncharacterized protein (DUF1499 family)